MPISKHGQTTAMSLRAGVALGSHGYLKIIRIIMATWLLFCWIFCAAALNPKKLLKMNKQDQEKLLLSIVDGSIAGVLSLVATNLHNEVNESQQTLLQTCYTTAVNSIEYAKCMKPYLDNSTVTASLLQQSHRQATKNADLLFTSNRQRRPRKRRSSMLNKRQLSYLQQFHRHHIHSAGNAKPETHVSLLAKWLTNLRRTTDYFRSRLGGRNITTDDVHTHVLQKERQLRKLMVEFLEDRDESTIPHFSELFDGILKAYDFIESQWKAGKPVKIPKWQRDILETVNELLSQFRKPTAEQEEDENLRSTRVLSPRLFSISRQHGKERGFLSPDVLSLASDQDDTKLKILPVQNRGDRQALTGLALEMSGAADILVAMKDVLPDATSNFEVYVKFAKSLVDFLYQRSIFKHQLYDLHRFFKNLDKTYTAKQKRELSTRGYTFVNSQQHKMVYGPDNPFNIKEVPFDYKRLTKLSEVERERELVNVARYYAQETAPRLKRRRKRNNAYDAVVFEFEEEPKLRRKRQVILNPIVIGANILTPTLLGPIVLSPLVLFPVVLAPLVLGIETTNAQVMAPVILSPLVLFPIIVSPRVLNPFTLSPLVLSPPILVPATMEPLILTPFVLSPIILSPQDRSVLVLSPLVYSPLIRTRLTNYVVALSPAIVARKRRSASATTAIPNVHIYDLIIRRLR